MRRKANTRKRLAATESRRECACKRTGEPSVTFCDKGGARKRADVFLHRKTEQSELCSDVVGMTGFEPATSASRTQRSTKLSHIPKYCNALYYTRKKNICQEDYMKILTLPAENGF